MALKLSKNCLYCSIIVAFMLFYQSASAQYNFTKADDWLAENVKDMGGRAIIMVSKNGKVIYSHAENELNAKQRFITTRIAKKSGKDAQELLQDYTDQTRLPIASCSKWLSAALVMTFVDDGSLKLTDTIGRFLPIMTMNGKGNITISQCLSHLTGIQSEGLKENKKLSTAYKSMNDAIASIAKIPMEALPGEAFHYSSNGLQIAAAVIEKISGKNFEQLFAERIAKPCQMSNTDFGHKNVPLPAGGAFSTPTDYIHFLQMILNKGTYMGIQVLTQQSITLMQQDYKTGKKILGSPDEAGNWGYGFGEWVISSTNGVPSEAVSSPGLFGTFPWVDNKNGYVGILFCFNLKHKGRNEKYTSLKAIIDNAISK